MVIKVAPIQDDISVISFGDDEIRIVEENEKNRRSDDGGPPTSRAARPRHDDGPTRRSGRCSKYLAAWSSTLPDAVGITGIQYIVNNQDHVLRRLMWVVAIVGGVAALSYQAVDRIVFFASNPKSVNVEIEYHDQMNFPAVTICNYNNFRNIDGNLDVHAFGYLLGEYSNVDENYVVNYTVYEPYLSDTNTTDLYLSLAHEMDYFQMFVIAYWDSKQVLVKQNLTRVITDFGVCYTFNDGINAGDSLAQTIAGKGHGLSIILDAQQEYYFYSSKKLQASAGFVVAVHDQQDVPRVDSMGVSVAPGTDVRIGLEKKQTANLPPPHGECGTRQLKYFSTYTENCCRQECLIEFVNEACGCVEPYMQVSDEFTVCNPIQVFSCVYTETERFSREGQCDCPVPCTLTTYSTSVSSSFFPSNFYSQKLVDLYASLGITLPENYFINNVAKIEVYFEQLKVEKLTQQEAYTFFALLCDLGGSLGLWLGGSILTFVEILDHFGHTTFIRGAAFNP